MHTLYACKGCGSAVVEALVERVGEPVRVDMLEWDRPKDWDRLRAVDPMAHVPTLVTDDGIVLAESAALVLWIVSRHPDQRLVPDDNAGRAAFLRWLVHLAVNVYAPIGIGDFPARWVGDDEAAHERLRVGTKARTQDAWRAFERAIAPAPFLLGDTLGALDVYVAMLTRWRPGRAWIAEHCPKVASAVARTESDPQIAGVWKRNFG